MNGFGNRTTRPVAVAMVALWLSAGCHSMGQRPFEPPAVPKELNKATLPDYRVEPPDILLIEAVRAIPKPPYKAEPLDVLYLHLAVPLKDAPLTGPISVDPDGTINLGSAYGGTVSVVGKTLEEIRAILEQHLREKIGLEKPNITVSLSQGRGTQRISGPHLIRPDGTISLGTYGSVRVTGMTLAEARHAIEQHLSAYLQDPEISVDVQNYNSKTYYVVLDGAGAGQTVVRLPVTGNETVIDAISQVNGLTAVSSQDRIWVSRPAPEGNCHQILPVDWKSVVECGDTATNYQLLPGDRVFVAGYPVVALETRMARLFAPIERIFGIALLGSSTYTSFRNINQPFGNQGFFP
jgi:polysaccharide biosynthesis/export protein